MATTDLMNQIADTYSKLTKAEKKVANVVLSSPQDVLNATITDLARMCNIGETSVFRFCRSLNLNGYQDFKLSLALSTANAGNLDKENINVNDSASGQEVAQKVLSAYKAALKDSYESLNFKTVSKAVELMLHARVIHFFGFGGSGISAMEAQNKFYKIMSNVVFNPDSHLQLTQASLIQPEDAAVIFCNSGITKDSIQIAKLCHQRNAAVIFITKFQKTPAAPYTDVLLLCGSNEGPMEGGSIATKTSQLFLIDILYAELFRKMGEKALSNKKITSGVIAEKMM